MLFEIPEDSPLGRVEAVFRGAKPRRTPLTIYESHMARSTRERELRQRGLCLVRRVTSWRMRYPHVESRTIQYRDERGRTLVRTEYDTPRGKLHRLVEPAPGTSWTHEHLFRTEDDYPALLSMLRDAVVEPDYEPVRELEKTLGADFLVRDNLTLEPLQSLVSDIMGTETFSYEWMDNRDLVLECVDALAATARRIYPIIADGPLRYVNYGGNVVPTIIGRQAFRDLYLPHYREAATILQQAGKRVGTHLDADNTLIMSDVPESGLDYIEAYDPGMGPSLGDALRAWPGMVLWINWPSAAHLGTEEDVRETTRRLIREAAPGDRLIIGITEDIPPGRTEPNLAAILDAIDEMGG